MNDLIDNTVTVISCGAPLTLYKPAMTMEQLRTAARRQGWAMMEATPVFGDGIQAPGFITLCKLRPNQYAVHFFNAQDGGFTNGEYHRDEPVAYEAYDRKIRRWTRHHQSDPLMMEGGVIDFLKRRGVEPAVKK